MPVVNIAYEEIEPRAFPRAGYTEEDRLAAGLYEHYLGTAYFDVFSRMVWL